MKRLFKLSFWLLLAFLATGQPASAQKEKVIKKGKAIFNKIKSFANPEDPDPPENTSPAREPAVYEEEQPAGRGQKRKLTPPDVRLQIDNARQALAGESLAEARFYVRQAIVGIELEMGYRILAGMPTSLMGQDYDEAQDEVFSTGAGFAGMVVARVYPHTDGAIKASLGSNSAYYQLAGMDAAYGDDSIKPVRFQGQKAYIKADTYQGYEFLVPIGQSSVFILECPPCQTETGLLELADEFDVAQYKTILGEQ